MVLGKGEESGAGLRFPHFALVVTSAVLLVVGLAGCAPSMSIRPPTASNIESVKNRQQAIALFRITTTIDGKAVSPLNPGDSNNGLRIYLASLDGMGAPMLVSPAAPSQNMAADGWHYLMLSPGVYYLLVLPPGVEQNPPAVAYHAGSARYGRLSQYAFVPGRGGFWVPELMAFVLGGTPPADFQKLPGFWFQVPENGQVVYLGSLSIACRSGRGVFGNLIDSCGDFQLVDDLQSAKQAIALSLTNLAVESLPLVLYGRLRPGARVPELGAMNVVARGPAKIEAAFTGAELAPWGVIPGTGRPRPIAVYNLMAIGAEMVTRAGAATRADGRRAEVQPCIDRLSASVATIDYASRFIPALEQAARAPGKRSSEATEGTGARHRLTTSLPLMRLRESGQSDSLALELALEVRIETVDDGEVRYYSVWYSAPELPIQSPLASRSPLYARFVPERPVPRSVPEWCGADGAALLEREVSAALSRIAAQVARDLRSSSEFVAGSDNGLK